MSRIYWWTECGGNESVQNGDEKHILCYISKICAAGAIQLKGSKACTIMKQRNTKVNDKSFIKTSQNAGKYENYLWRSSSEARFTS